MTLLILTILYVCSAPIALPDMDAGEFLAIAAVGGIAHPPGYPLYSLMLELVGQLASLFPGTSLITWTVGLSLIFGWLVCYFAFRIAWILTRSWFVASVSTIFILLSSPVWRNQITVEPFALNNLLSMFVLFCSLKLMGLDEQDHLSGLKKWLFLLGMSFGLGFCHHHSLVLLVPIAVLALVTYFRSHDWQSAYLFVIGFAVGLLPLLQFARHFDDKAVIWGDWQNFWPTLWAHLLRKDYGTFSLVQVEKSAWYTAPIYFLQSLPENLGYLTLAIVCLGAFSLFSKDGRNSDARRLNQTLFVTGSFLCCLLASLGFLSLFHSGDSDLEKMVIERFFALPIILLLPLVAVGFAALDRLPFRRRVLLIVVAFAAVLHILLQWQSAERRSETFFQQHFANMRAFFEDQMTRTSSRSPIIVNNSDASLMGSLYFRAVHPELPSIPFYHYGLMMEWYVSQVEKDLDLRREDVLSGPVAVMRQLQAQHEIYLLQLDSDVMSEMIQHSYPIGPFIKLAKPSENLPEATELAEENRRLYSEVLVLPSTEQVALMKPWEHNLLQLYLRTWETILPVLAQSGQSDLIDYAKDQVERLKQH